MSMTLEPIDDFDAIGSSDMKPVVDNLRATVGILGHLITVNSSSTNIVDDDAWRKVESDLDNLIERVEHMWLILWEQRTDEVAELKETNAAAIAAAKAEAAPGSPADIKHAEALWGMLRAFVKMAGEECDKAGGMIKAGPPTA